MSSPNITPEVVHIKVYTDSCYQLANLANDMTYGLPDRSRLYQQIYDLERKQNYGLIDDIQQACMSEVCG